MEEHKHCKRCKAVMPIPNYDTPMYDIQAGLYWDVEICLQCIALEVIKKAKNKKKSKPEDMEFGKK
ncbi:MAG TPA: hypothetical protein VMZ91_16325 [Candidatus Paceibacterota bacterium]|nr:hypothetical protein [Candidatus Paceibacterota bacterium]